MRFHLKSDRPTNLFADLEAHLRALGASGLRLAEATTSLRESARVFAMASHRMTRNARLRLAARRGLKLV